MDNEHLRAAVGLWRLYLDTGHWRGNFPPDRMTGSGRSESPTSGSYPAAQFAQISTSKVTAGGWKSLRSASVTSPDRPYSSGSRQASNLAQSRQGVERLKVGPLPRRGPDRPYSLRTTALSGQAQWLCPGHRLGWVFRTKSISDSDQATTIADSISPPLSTYYIAPGRLIPARRAWATRTAPATSPLPASSSSAKP